MSEIELRFSDNEVVWDFAYSQRDTIANIVYVLQGNEIIGIYSPCKNICVEVDTKGADKLVKYYKSNRGVKYVTVYVLDEGQWVQVYRTERICRELLKYIPKDLYNIIKFD